MLWGFIVRTNCTKYTRTSGIRHSATGILQQEQGVKAIADAGQIVGSNESGWQRDGVVAWPDRSVTLCAVDESYGTIRDGI